MEGKIKLAVQVLLVLGIVIYMMQKRKAIPKEENHTTITKEAVKVENIKIMVTMKTNKGDIKLNLFPEEAPVTVINFLNLAKKGYYDGLKFHRVIADFMIQGGCPQGTGMGGPGYNFRDEFVRDLVFDKPGILAMANSGPNTNGSQFFITHVETPWLNHKHTIFGEVVESADQDVVNAISQGDTIEGIEITGDVDKLFDANKELLGQLNKELAHDFPNLK